MNDMKQSMLGMFDLLSNEKELLVSQLSEELDEIKRLELNQELRDVSGVLSEIATLQ